MIAIAIQAPVSISLASQDTAIAGRGAARVAAALLLAQFGGMWGAVFVLPPSIDWPASLDEPAYVLLPILLKQAVRSERQRARAHLCLPGPPGPAASPARRRSLASVAPPPPCRGSRPRTLASWPGKPGARWRPRRGRMGPQSSRRHAQPAPPAVLTQDPTDPGACRRLPVAHHLAGKLHPVDGRGTGLDQAQDRLLDQYAFGAGHVYDDVSLKALAD